MEDKISERIYSPVFYYYIQTDEETHEMDKLCEKIEELCILKIEDMLSKAESELLGSVDFKVETSVMKIYDSIEIFDMIKDYIISTMEDEDDEHHSYGNREANEAEVDRLFSSKYSV